MLTEEGHRPPLTQERIEYAFRGVYRKIAVPERLVQTFEWEDSLGNVIVETGRASGLWVRPELHVADTAADLRILRIAGRVPERAGDRIVVGDQCGYPLGALPA